MTQQNIPPGLRPKPNGSFVQQTQQQTQVRKINRPDVEVVERPDPKFVQFAEGEMIEGILLSIETIRVGQPPKNASKYTVEEWDTGEVLQFLGTYQIDTKLRPQDLGHKIWVKCEGSDSNVTRNGRPMKLFRVGVSDQAVPGFALDGSRITDEDLPPEAFA